MNYTGFNMNSVKNANRAAVLYLLNSGEVLSRKDIAERLKLTPAAVSKICAELISEGAIAECGRSESTAGAGRKKLMLSLNSKEIFSLALSIERSGFYSALCSLDGEEIYGERCLFTNISNARECLSQIGKKCREIIKKNGVDRSKIIGAGVGLVGGVDVQNGTTAGNYGIWKAGIPVRDILENELSLPVCVENNVKAFAIASLLFDRGCLRDNLLFVKWGPGVGSAIVVGGTVLGRSDSDSSELGHYTAVTDGKKCRCGRIGCLETEISSEAIIERVKMVFSPDKTPKLFEMAGGEKKNIDISAFLAAKEDHEVKKELFRSVQLLALAVSNAATVLAPDRVIVFGYMFEKETFEFFKRAYAEERCGFSKGGVHLSPLDKKHRYIGPAAVAAKYFFFEKKE